MFVPFGTTVGARHELMAAAAQTFTEPDRPIVSAGRSGRDYATLAAAVQGLPCRLEILCDTLAPVAHITPSAQIRVIYDSFDRAYLEHLAAALFIVVPLSVDGISAGQMVLLQAAALGKAVIVTRTATTLDYATDDMDAVLVDMGDVAGMRAAILRLLNDPPARARLGANAARRFERDHSTEAFVRNLVKAVGWPVPAPVSEPPCPA